MALADNLVGYWSPWLGSSGYRLLDRSGRGNHGTLTNMDAGTDWVGATVRGRSGSVLNIQDNQSVNCGLAPALNFTGPFSATIWVRNITSNTGTDFGILSKSLAGWNILSTASVNGKVWAYWNNGGRATGATTITSVASWQLLGISWTGTTAQVWVNGLLDGSAATTAAPNAANNDFHIGRYVTVNNRSMTGDFAEAVAWNRALTLAEHVELYRLGPGWYQPYQRKRYAFVAAQFNRRRRILCGDYS